MEQKRPPEDLPKPKPANDETNWLDKMAAKLAETEMGEEELFDRYGIDEDYQKEYVRREYRRLKESDG